MIIRRTAATLVFSGRLATYRGYRQWCSKTSQWHVNTYGREVGREPYGDTALCVIVCDLIFYNVVWNRCSKHHQSTVDLETHPKLEGVS